ncbi:MAG: efflux RND transporter permease subunit, partial [Gammaproteobacteria bacterium]|nr:efflux RND transporter permease subunit [Gammaproteobacteria bacterium]
GPYMAPMAFNVPVTVILSTVVAFLVTPWTAMRILRPAPRPAESADGRPRRADLYERLLRPLLRRPRLSLSCLFLVGVLFLLALLMPALRMVPLKLLPYDNKNELQLVLDMPEGTSLERTRAVAERLALHLSAVAEVVSVAGFVGIPSPVDFNGLIRQYYLRLAPHQADLRVVLADKRRRSQQSHAIALRLREALTRIATESGGTLAIVESPPGPPVTATLTVEVYGDTGVPYARVVEGARRLAARLEREPLVVDVDVSAEQAHPRTLFVTDRDKAALSGVATEDVVATLALASAGSSVGQLHDPYEVGPLPIELRLPLEQRSDWHALGELAVKGRAGIARVRERSGVRDAPQPLVRLAEIGHFEQHRADQPILHKDLRPVAYVFAEISGRAPAAVVADLLADRLDEAPAASASSPRPLDSRSYLRPGGGDAWALPAGVSTVWTGEGEWRITVQVFRDLGIAFAVALLGIFLVLLVQTRLAALTLIIMSAIPLTMIGIMPGFWALNRLLATPVAGFPDPVLFTATAMIGMIALAGIVVRNSLVLVEFVRQSVDAGMALDEALLRAGSVRMRPVLLTAGTTLLGNLVITLDPIFSGLAWAIIFGVLASTVFTLLVVPITYRLVYADARTPAEGGVR